MSTSNTPVVEKVMLTGELLEQEMTSYCRLVPQENAVRVDKRQPRFGQYLLMYYDISHLPVNVPHIQSTEHNDEVYQVLNMALFTYAIKGPSEAIPKASAEIVSISPKSTPAKSETLSIRSSIDSTIQGSNVVSLFS